MAAAPPARGTGRLRLTPLRVSPDQRPLDPVQRLVQPRPGRRRIIGEPSRESPRSRSLGCQRHRGPAVRVVEADLQPRRSAGCARTAFPRSPAPTRSAPRAPRWCSGSRRARRCRARSRARWSSVRAARARRVTSSTRIAFAATSAAGGGDRRPAPRPAPGAAITRVRETRGSGRRRWRTGATRSLTRRSLALQAAQVPDQQQMLEVPADRGEALEVLDRLLAPRLASRAKRRPTSCSSSAASRSAEVRKTRRLRPATPNRESSAAARTISRSVSS